ncbi:TPA: hypothetical protein JZG05_003946 [Escherichia coli]|nr:hypothetical protein [Escherichia coli]HAM3730265.1 hypothetical protein [Escherichia coli]HAX4929396.1 hypothetical protein [Escherichia coli]
MALCKSDKGCFRNRETSPFWCADVLVFVQWNEAAIVRLLTVSDWFSGTRNGCGVLLRQGMLSWQGVRVVTSIRQGR